MISKLFSLFSKAKNLITRIHVKWRTRRDGINLIGYFSSIMGVAEVGRFFSIKLAQGDIPFDIYNIRLESHKALDEGELKKFTKHYKAQSNYFVNIAFINADQIYLFAKSHPSIFRHHYNIGVFWWEFDDYFDFPAAFKHIQEVIVFSEFIATAVKKTAPSHIRVTKLPFPFIKNWKISVQPSTIRKKYSILDSDFTFIFNFDFYSIFERKNPDAVLLAFQKAFLDEPGAKLIMKTLHSEKVPDKYQKFIELINELHIRDQVIIIDESLSRQEMLDLINTADAYVSLHRSEGLGIGMLEAMSMGKPVIGTRFGGNMEFMNENVSLLVNYTLVPLEKDALPYRKGWLWADADTDQAAAYMRKLYSDREFGISLGKKAEEFIQKHYSQENFIKALKEWSKETPIRF